MRNTIQVVLDWLMGHGHNRTLRNVILELYEDFCMEVPGSDHRLTLEASGPHVSLLYSMRCFHNPKRDEETRYMMSLSATETEQSLRAKHDAVVSWYTKRIKQFPTLDHNVQASGQASVSPDAILEHIDPSLLGAHPDQVETEVVATTQDGQLLMLEDRCEPLPGGSLKRCQEDSQA